MMFGRLGWISLLLVLLGGCKQDPEPTGPLPGYSPDSELFATEDFELVEVDPALPRIAVNLIVVRLREGMGREDADRLAEDVSGEVVGQLPDIRAYQIDVGTTSVGALNDKITALEGDEVLEAIGYDLEVIGFNKELELCPPPSDNDIFTGNDRCPFDDSRYYHALSIYKRLETDAPVDPVWMGVVDNGFKYTHAELKTAKLANAHADDGELDDKVSPWINPKNGKPDPHGTQVAGVMVAANNLVGKNGIFSPFGDERRLILGKNVGTEFNGTTFGLTTTLQLVSEAGAKVINVSQGTDKDLHDVVEHADWWGTAIENGKLQMQGTSGQTLYVAAAPYDPPIALDGTNHYPAGMDLDNLITVAASFPCEQTEPEPGSSTGTIDIFAQGTAFPRLDMSSDEGVIIDPDSGRSSMAAPQVASLAAVLYSIQPNKSPAQIKDYVLDDAGPGPSMTAGRYVDHATPVARAFYERSDLSSEGKELLDSNDDKALDDIGIIVGRLCGKIVYDVEKVGSTTLTGTDIARESSEGPPIEDNVGGFVQALGFGWTMDAKEADSFLGFVCSGCAFDLTEFPAGPDSGGVQVAYTRGILSDGDFEGGSATSGTFELEKCEVLERIQLDDDLPLVIFVEGKFDIDLDYLPAGATMSEGRKLAGSFDLPFALNPLPDDPIITQVETLCVGGKLYGG